MSILTAKSPGSDWKRSAMMRVIQFYGILSISDEQKRTLALALKEPVSEIEAWLKDAKETLP